MISLRLILYEILLFSRSTAWKSEKDLRILKVSIDIDHTEIY